MVKTKVIDITPKINISTELISLAAYTRVSSDSEDQMKSFMAQIKYYKDYERMHPEYKLVDIYADEGITGTSMGKRDEFNRMIRDCERGKIKRVITKSVSRFARNTEELILTIRKLKELGVSIYFEEQDIDTDKLTLEMILTFPGIAAQKESEAISGNMRWSLQKRMESGEFNTTQPPYGYRLINNQLVIFEEEAKVVRRIFELFLNGYGKYAIAKILNNEGVPRRKGKGIWYNYTINYILNNERYMGDALLQKTYSTDVFPYKKRINHGERPKYYVENSNLPIVSRETFMKAQELQKSKENYLRAKNNNHHLLTGIICCSECGCNFRRQTLNEKIYWVCGGKASGTTKCGEKRVREDAIYNAFIYMLIKLCDYRKTLIEELISQVEYIQSQNGEGFAEVKDIDNQIADIATQKLVVTRLHTSGILKADEYALQSSELDYKINQLRAKRKKLLDMDENNCMLTELKTLNDVISHYTYSGIFDEEVFCEIVECIEVYNNTEIKFKLIGGLELDEIILENERCKSA